MKRGLPGRRGQTFRPAPVFQGTGTGSLPQLALPHAGTTSRLGRTHEASHRCPYNSGVNATLPSITPAPGDVEKTSTIEHPRLRLLPGALLPAHWLGGGLLNDRLPGIRQALAEGRLRLRTLPLNAPADSDWAHDRWLREHPAQARQVMQTNPGVVFFRELATDPADPEAGPVGALGVPLTPGRSLAVDRSRIPLGSAVFIQSTHPVSQQPMERLMLAQDTGGAIKGGRRADYFWGFGHEAGLNAGLMKAPVRMWLLAPR